MKKGDKVKWNLRNDEAKDISTKIQTIDFVFMNRQRRAGAGADHSGKNHSGRNAQSQ
jgi:hypothetical protein